MTVIPSALDALDTFDTMAELADGLKPWPPYSVGMMRPKKRSSLSFCQTLSGSSRRCHTSQSSVMRHTSSTGPSMNACSAGVRSGYGCARMRLVSGLPENSSPSTQTVPASMASCSVCEMTGRNCIASIAFMTPPESTRRTGGMRKTRLSTAKTAVSHSGAPNPTSATSPSTAQATSGAPVKPSTNSTSTTPTTAAQAGVNAERAPWTDSRAFIGAENVGTG